VFVCILAFVISHAKRIFSAQRYTRWFKYDRDKLWLVYTQSAPVIFEPPCIYCHLWPVWFYYTFPHYHLNSSFRKQIYLTQNVFFWFCLQLVSEIFLILRIVQQDIFINVHNSSCKVIFHLSQTLVRPLIFLRNFRKVLKYQVSWKSVQWEASCSIQTDGRIDRQIWES
jgi:hypothetical protein